MAIIKDEIQTGKSRLLCFSGKLPKDLYDTVDINGIRYKIFIVYDMPNSIAIECEPGAPSLIGYAIKA